MLFRSRSREESVFDPASVRSLPTPTVRRALARRERLRTRPFVRSLRTPTVRRALARRERLRPGQRALAPNPDCAACARERRECAIPMSANKNLTTACSRSSCAQPIRAQRKEKPGRDIERGSRGLTSGSSRAGITTRFASLASRAFQLEFRKEALATIASSSRLILG